MRSRSRHSTKKLKRKQQASKTRKKQKPLLSVLRYPGGKSWLKPMIEKWLTPPVDHLVEPFVGGGNVTLTALSKNLTKRATLLEIDQDVAAIWTVVLNGQADWLIRKIARFKVNRTGIKREIQKTGTKTSERAWRTLLRNRMSHGGILAPGAGILRLGENKKGLSSRWYSKTLRNRIRRINRLKRKITFQQTDAIAWLQEAAKKKSGKTTAYFIDPPYANAGRRLYAHNEVDHRKLFDVVSKLRGKILMTYENTPEVRKLAAEFHFQVETVDMRSRLHRKKTELLISNDLSWLNA